MLQQMKKDLKDRIGKKTSDKKWPDTKLKKEDSKKNNKTVVVKAKNIDQIGPRILSAWKEGSPG